MHNELVAGIRDAALQEAASLNKGTLSPFQYGTFIESETVDSDLSKIQMSGEAALIIRGVRKLKHVTMTAGDSVMMVKSGTTPLTIVGVVVGNINAIEVDA